MRQRSIAFDRWMICWMELQLNRELEDLFTATRIQYDWEGYGIVTAHAERICMPFAIELGEDPAQLDWGKET